MSSKTTSFNSRMLKTVLKKNAHFRKVRETHPKKIAKNKIRTLPDENFERQLQSFLHDTLVQAYSFRVRSFLVAWNNGNDKEIFDLHSQLFSKCLQGRWVVEVVNDVDRSGAPGWHFTQV